jgi:hypothetical protein
MASPHIAQTRKERHRPEGVPGHRRPAAHGGDGRGHGGGCLRPFRRRQDDDLQPIPSVARADVLAGKRATVAGTQAKAHRGLRSDVHRAWRHRGWQCCDRQRVHEFAAVRAEDQRGARRPAPSWRLEAGSHHLGSTPKPRYRWRDGNAVDLVLRVARTLHMRGSNRPINDLP